MSTLRCFSRGTCFGRCQLAAPAPAPLLSFIFYSIAVSRSLKESTTPRIRRETVRCGRSGPRNDLEDLNLIFILNFRLGRRRNYRPKPFLPFSDSSLSQFSKERPFQTCLILSNLQTTTNSNLVSFRNDESIFLIEWIPSVLTRLIFFCLTKADAIDKSRTFEYSNSGSPGLALAKLNLPEMP